MKNSKKYIAAAAAFGVAATLVAIAPAAHAEPVADGYVVVGSDTLQDVLNGLVNGTNITGTNVRINGSSVALSSFDAIGGAANIQTKPYGPVFGRPNGSGDGVKALSRSIDGASFDSATPGDIGAVVITGQVDMARSSSGGTQNANGGLLYVPFGRDGLSYAHNSTNVAFDNIDQATLKGIFEGTITTINGSPVVPVIPQAGSGTRKDFISKIGSTEAAVQGQVNAGVVKVGQEHDTRALQDGSPMPANSVTAMSAAQWVAQNTGAGQDRRGAGFKIGSPIAGVPAVTGEGAAMVPNAAFYADSTWGRNTFVIVENARVTPGDAKYDPKLANLVSSGKLANHTALPTSAGAVKQKYGFLAPSTTTAFRVNLS
ncbi:substrate-binding domain-containing protein [Leucobacter sp. Z1108]|uniref:substrate-binding domain-containing protein n=1 Tax=Leucobacter sp. Z1108 TaxID=3439066 RepID=UPI003F331E12